MLDRATKARLKVAYGAFKVVNSIAGGFGYGAFSYVTGNHRHSHHAFTWARFGIQSGKQTLEEGLAELARAKR